MDYQVSRCTRHCSHSGRELREGEEFFSALVAQGAELVRQDFCREAWSGPPEEAIGWWKSRIPTREETRARLAPSEVLLQLFHELQEQPDKQDMRYVLALLLVRRRILRLEDTIRDELGQEILSLYCSRAEETYEVTTAMPSESRTAEIQQELETMLYADAK